MENHQREPERGHIGDTDEPAKLYVADPEDYAKTRKLKALNDAKEHVRKVRNNRPNTANTNEWKGMGSRLSEAVASFGHELLPLLDEAENVGIIDDPEYVTAAFFKEIDVRHFIMLDGSLRSKDGEVYQPPAVESMAVYRQLQRLERTLGLGLKLESEEKDEWEIQI